MYKDMKKRLDELSLHDYIELCSGDLSVLGAGDDEERELVALRLRQDYKRVADPSGYRSAVSEVEDYTRESVEAGFYRLVVNLTLLEAYGEARGLLEEAGRDVRGLDGAGLKALAEGELKRALFEMERHLALRKGSDAGERDGGAVREAFHREVAAVMVYFRMTIDLEGTNALVYASMVRQAREDARQREALARGMRRKGY